MAQGNSCHRLKQALCALIINALLLTQQGFLFQAIAQTVVEAPQTVSGPGSIGAVGAGLGSASSLSGANLVLVGAVSGLSPAALGAVPTVIPQLSMQHSASAAAAQAAAPSPTKAETSVRLAKISEGLQSDLKVLSSQDVQGDQAQSLGGRVMDKALGLKPQDLPALAEPTSAADARYYGAKVHVALKRRALGPAEAQSRDGSWWKDPASQHIAVTVPLYALRRTEGDPGIGKFTDFGDYYRDVLAAQGVDTIHLLPHFAVLDESPYAPVSLYALNESNVDWAAVDEVSKTPELLAKLAVPDQADREAVNYKALWTRDEAVGQEAYRIFQRDHVAHNTPRLKAYIAFLRENAYWIKDYGEFMALSRLIGKPALAMDPGRRAARPARSALHPAHEHALLRPVERLPAVRRGAMDTIHQAGGHVLFDIPMFRAKNSVDAWKHPEYFTDIKTRNPGIVNQWSPRGLAGPGPLELDQAQGRGLPSDARPLPALAQPGLRRRPGGRPAFRLQLRRRPAGQRRRAGRRLCAALWAR